jgi:hypothetical protein
VNKKSILGLIVMIGAICITFSIYSSTSADSAAVQPGSVDDPMVSKSYVDEQVKTQVAAQVTSQVNTQVAAAIEQLKKDLPISSGSGGGAALKVVKLPAGQILMAGTGSEFIVRTGFVKAVSTDGNGIPDVTGGKDIADKASVELNHLLIFPTDKRGVMPDPKKNVPIVVMVRGGYKLVNTDGSDVTEAASVATPTTVPIGSTVTPAPVISP